MIPESTTQAFFFLFFFYSQWGFPTQGRLFFYSSVEPEPRRVVKDEDASCFTSLSTAVRGSDSLPTIHLYHITAS